MSTPITDAVTGHSPLHKVENLQWVARRLETDRAALMEALGKTPTIAGHYGDAAFGPRDDFARGRQRGRDEARDAIQDFVNKTLTAARANFPADIIGG